jgi:hypothetical protein
MFDYGRSIGRTIDHRDAPGRYRPPAVGHGAPGAPGTTLGVPHIRMPDLGRADVWNAQGRPRGPRSTIAHRREVALPGNGHESPGMGANGSVEARDLASTGRRPKSALGVRPCGTDAAHGPERRL